MFCAESRSLLRKDSLTFTPKAFGLNTKRTCECLFTENKPTPSRDESGHLAVVTEVPTSNYVGSKETLKHRSNQINEEKLCPTNTTHPSSTTQASLMSYQDWRPKQRTGSMLISEKRKGEKTCTVSIFTMIISGLALHHRTALGVCISIIFLM